MRTYNLTKIGTKFKIKITQGISNSNESVKSIKKALKKAKYIQLKSSIQGSNKYINENNSSSTNSSSNCDDFLRNYEKFMNNYIEIIKKQKNNPTDASIIAEYTSIMSQLSDWNIDKMEGCNKDPDFISKFTTIQLKIANASSGL